MKCLLFATDEMDYFGRMDTRKGAVACHCKNFRNIDVQIYCSEGENMHCACAETIP